MKKILTLVLSIASMSAWGAQYYVDPVNGNDANSGLLGYPWRTITHAITVMTAGDSLQASPGDYTGEGRITVSQSGVSGNPIYFAGNTSRGYEGTIEKVAGWNISGNYIDVRGFRVTDLTDDVGMTAMGFYVTGSHCTIMYNEIRGNLWGGIVLDSSSSACSVRFNTVWRNGMVGIEFMGQSHLITDNEIYQTIQHHPCNVLYATDPNLDADGFRGFGSGHTLTNNYVHDIVFGAPGYTSGKACTEANVLDLTIDYNDDPHIDCIQTWNGDGYTGLTNTAVDRLRCEEPYASNSPNAGPAEGFEFEDAGGNIQITNSIIHAINVGYISNTPNVRFYENTFVGVASGTGPYYLGTSNNGIVKDNIFVRYQGGHVVTDGTPTGIVANYNDVWTASGSAPQTWRGANDKWMQSPQFVNESSGNYHLQSTSPARDTGTTIGKAYDFELISRPQGGAYDMGAYEYH